MCDCSQQPCVQVEPQIAALTRSRPQSQSVFPDEARRKGVNGDESGHHNCAYRPLTPARTAGGTGAQ
jgi:hypothetical protein